ncbi:MAG TPA: hypothetical protein VLV78_11530 [Thermoanaerobaculia bacterium]|nr:hypothetical protein [Thermoanaerobaculia bacterium]
MRFFCEWCHERVDVKHTAAPYREVLAHLSSCDHRSEGTSLAHVAGLARHIATIVVEQNEISCPTCGDAIRLQLGSWYAIQKQILGHLEACSVAADVGLRMPLLLLMSHTLAHEFCEKHPSRTAQ